MKVAIKYIVNEHCCDTMKELIDNDIVVVEPPGALLGCEQKGYMLSIPGYVPYAVLFCPNCGKKVELTYTMQ
jgi:hypothetical protein